MVRRVCLSLSVLGFVGLTLVGCSRYQKEQRAEWRSAAENACLRSGVVKETANVRIAKALEGVGSCGADFPIKVSAFSMDNVSAISAVPGFSSAGGSFLTRLNQEGTLTCPMYSAVDRWLEQVVQPAAMARFGQTVVELRTMGTYSCRRMNNGSGTARFSEHAFANAIDVGGFRLQDGSIITVLKGWKGGLEEQNFLREVHAGACRNFATVLGPGADAFHYDHFHMDLARHGRTGNRSICRPYPQPVTPPNESFPVDPARNSPVADARDVLPVQPVGQAFASIRGAQSSAAGAATLGHGVLPAYRPAQLPVIPRNPIAEREREDLGQAPERQRPGPAGAPVILYGRGQGPFLPLPENEIDPADLDPITGSVGE
ncbi:MAG: extensin family protein [Beijerinckiaceae bacterium]